MDPITQGVVGATASTLAGVRKQHALTVAALGALAGMAPDLDVFVQSPSDPLLFLDYHRHFTHALVFIPVGAFIVALVLHRLYFSRRLSFAQTYLYCLIGYATHGILDCFTTYGTHLLWPFSDARIAWNSISVIDPLFTIPALTLLIFSVKKKSRVPASFAVIWAVLYLGFGTFQKHRAEDAVLALAEKRGHTVTRHIVKPVLANLFLWSVIYEHQGHYYLNGARTGQEAIAWSGTCFQRFSPERLPWLDASTQQGRDVARFSRFSNHYIAHHNTDDLTLMDIRYSLSLDANKIAPIWSIRLESDRDASDHVEYITSRRAPAGQMGALWRLLHGDLSAQNVDTHNTCP